MMVFKGRTLKNKQNLNFHIHTVTTSVKNHQISVTFEWSF